MSVFLSLTDAYQDTDIVYSWGEAMNGAFANIKDASFDIPSYEISSIELDSGKHQYSIGKVFTWEYL